jgi:nucleoside-diphosphate-sugar epimerase
MNTSIPWSVYQNRSVLITGGLGFIGSTLARRLVEIGGVTVHLLDAMLEGQGGNAFNIRGIEDRLIVHKGDLRDREQVIRLVADTDYVFNLAGSVSHVDSMHYPQHDLELNCRAQLELLEACRHHNRGCKIVFTSTRQVYGRPVYLPLDEQHPLAPVDVNGVHKLAAENYHLLYQGIFGMRTVCLRLTNTYGPRQLLKHNRQGFIAWFVRQALEGGVIDLYGDGKQRRDIVYVEDVIDALLLAGASAAAEGQIFNVGGGEPVSLVDIAEALVSLTRRGSVHAVSFPSERREIDIGDTYSSNKKIESTLGWRPVTNWRSGLAQTIDFYRANLAHYC